MWVMNRITVGAREREPDLRGENIKKILLVRSLFRMGDSILATPAISLLRQNFPEATIDFVGPPVEEKLLSESDDRSVLRNLPSLSECVLVLSRAAPAFAACEV